MSLNLVEAFGTFGAKPNARPGSTSAMAADGALVLACSYRLFGHPAAGVLRYEDRLSREDAGKKGNDVLARHLALARDSALPVRMVVVTATSRHNSRTRRNFHVRSDLIGKMVKFDGDHFIIDFTRMDEPHRWATRKRK